MVHAGHLAHTGPHAGHAHIVHTEGRALPQGRDGCRHTHSRGQGAAGHTRAVHRFRDDREGTVLAGLHDHIIGFRDGDLELLDGHRPDILSVGIDHGHAQARDAHMEDRHGGGVDDAQPDPLAWPE